MFWKMKARKVLKISAGHERAVKALESKQLLSPMFEHADMGTFGS